MDLKHKIRAKVEIIFIAGGGALVGGVAGRVIRSALWVGEASFLERILSLWGSILLGTLLALWIVLRRMLPPAQVWRTTSLVVGVALLLSGIALGIFTGPLQRYVPIWILRHEVLFWLPFMPLVAALLATMLVTVFLPLSPRPERPTLIHREYPILH